MILFTSVWGNEYLSYMERGLLTSFRWPQNRKALEGARWFISNPNPAERQRIQNAVRDLPIELEFMNMGGDLMGAFKKVIRQCIDQKRPFFMAPPDTIYSEGSIAAMKQVGQQKNVCVGSAHMRVLPSYLDAEIPSDAAQMVSRAWEHIHDSWKLSGARTGPSFSHYGGVYWQEFGKLVFVQHRLPTTYLANLTEQDWNFFQGQINFGVWDHVWPSHCLIDTERLRILGSSDAAFMVEITKPQSNMSIVQNANEAEPDSFHGNGPHNKTNRLFVSVFRKA